MSLESSGILQDHKHAGIFVSTKGVDTGAQLVAGLTSTLDPDEALRISINIFVWAVALACHAACKNFAGLLVVRLLLVGVCKGSITAGFLITLRYWFLMNGTAQIISGFISCGTLHINTKGFQPWQWFMIITVLITLILAVSFWFLFPDSPTNAWFLTLDERAKAVQRIKENQTGAENKHFKMEQMIEALTDPKTWLFALFSALDYVPNSLTNQQALILASFGFSALQTTLLSCVPGIVEILTIFTGVRLAARRPNSRAYVGAIYQLNLLPWSNRVSVVCVPGFVLSLSWLDDVTTGHTKKEVVCPVLLLIIRAVLVRENKIRDAEPRITEDGKRVEVKVDKEFLDLTGRQNRDLRYVS
ncbi:major facilitator superfamily domain-containing protein [Suillus plorans]|uniref:Major facilitator superfamily domain-containing protein n=1 Tax=Suillus plorans TaxID=116603 RepID=A0A9P7AQU3_9AGAM|nr:major facilitator superfamily domain-containing protein [Suillus plorans]KAG1794618.1 major facilitator superfamily domain-containing protein [Suillus plorans]